MSSTTRWLGPISGLAAVALAILGEGMSSTGLEPSDSSRTILAELHEKSDDMQTGVIFGVFAIGLLLVYIGHLRTRFYENGAGWAGNVFAAGGVAVVGGLLIFIAADLTGAEAGQQGHAEVAQGFVDFNWNGVWLFSPGLLAVGIAVAVASFSDHVLPAWLGALGVLLAVSAIAPWIGLPIFMLWVVAASVHELVSVIRDRGATQSSDAATA